MKLFLALVVAGLCGCQSKKESATGSNEVALTVTDAGFEPRQTYVPKGQAFTLVVTRTSDKTCATDIVIASLKQRHPLPLNQAVRIEIPAGVQDSLTYACGMDMFGGTILAK